jgi:hypothetical protein
VNQPLRVVAVRPASMTRTWPVTQRASSLASTAPATSQPVPSVPSGEAFLRRSRASAPSRSTIGVQTWPGAMALTRMPLGPSCTATLVTKPMTPALAAA